MVPDEALINLAGRSPGLELGVVLSGANRHAAKFLKEARDNIIIFRPAVSEGHPQNFRPDAGREKAQNYLALIHFACSIIVWRKLAQVHR